MKSKKSEKTYIVLVTQPDGTDWVISGFSYPPEPDKAEKDEDYMREKPEGYKLRIAPLLFVCIGPPNNGHQAYDWGSGEASKDAAAFIARKVPGGKVWAV
jgi:hypothetical protein